MADVFISYCRARHAQARRLAETLQRVHLEPFLDKGGGSVNLSHRAPWDETLHEEIFRSLALVPLISKEWQASEWCQRELDSAISMRRPIAPIFMDDQFSGKGARERAFQSALQRVGRYDITRIDFGKRDADEQLDRFARDLARAVHRNKTGVGHSRHPELYDYPPQFGRFLEEMSPTTVASTPEELHALRKAATSRAPDWWAFLQNNAYYKRTGSLDAAYGQLQNWIADIADTPYGDLPVFWIRGVRFSGKSTFLLQLCREILVNQQNAIVIQTQLQALPAAILECERRKAFQAGSVYFAVDDMHVMQQPDVWQDEVRQIPAPLRSRVRVIACGHDTGRQFIESRFRDLVEITDYTLLPPSAAERREIAEWFGQTPAPANDDLMGSVVYESAHAANIEHDARALSSICEGAGTEVRAAVLSALAANALGVAPPVSAVAVAASGPELGVATASFSLVQASDGKTVVRHHHPKVSWQVFQKICEWQSLPTFETFIVTVRALSARMARAELWDALDEVAIHIASELGDDDARDAGFPDAAAVVAELIRPGKTGYSPYQMAMAPSFLLLARRARLDDDAVAQLIKPAEAAAMSPAMRPETKVRAITALLSNNGTPRWRPAPNYVRTALADPALAPLCAPVVLLLATRGSRDAQSVKLVDGWLDQFDAYATAGIWAARIENSQFPTPAGLTRNFTEWATQNPAKSTHAVAYLVSRGDRRYAALARAVYDHLDPKTAGAYHLLAILVRHTGDERLIQLAIERLERADDLSLSTPLLDALVSHPRKLGDEFVTVIDRWISNVDVAKSGPTLAARLLKADLPRPLKLKIVEKGVELVRARPQEAASRTILDGMLQTFAHIPEVREAAVFWFESNPGHQFMDIVRSAMRGLWKDCPAVVLAAGERWLAENPDNPSRWQVKTAQTVATGDERALTDLLADARRELPRKVVVDLLRIALFRPWPIDVVREPLMRLASRADSAPPLVGAFLSAQHFSLEALQLAFKIIEALPVRDASATAKVDATFVKSIPANVGNVFEALKSSALTDAQRAKLLDYVITAIPVDPRTPRHVVVNLTHAPPAALPRVLAAIAQAPVDPSVYETEFQDWLGQQPAAERASYLAAMGRSASGKPRRASFWSWLFGRPRVAQGEA